MGSFETAPYTSPIEEMAQLARFRASAVLKYQGFLARYFSIFHRRKKANIFYNL